MKYQHRNLGHAAQLHQTPASTGPVMEICQRPSKARSPRHRTSLNFSKSTSEKSELFSKFFSNFSEISGERNNFRMPLNFNCASPQFRGNLLINFGNLKKKIMSSTSKILYSTQVTQFGCKLETRVRCRVIFAYRSVAFGCSATFQASVMRNFFLYELYRWGTRRHIRIFFVSFSRMINFF